MSFAHCLLTLLVVCIWGFNFIFVKFGLDEVSPLLLCALRFFFASVPAIFFIKLPPISFRIIATYGLIMFALQFGFVFTGMQVGMPPGMASLLMQVQVFFTIIFSVIFFGERPGVGQTIGSMVSFLGIGLVAMHFDDKVSLLGFLLLMGAAASWGVGNLVSKKIPGTHMMAVIVWGSFVAVLPMLFISVLFEGTGAFISAYQQITWKGGLSLAYIVYMSTWIGYGVWGWLIGRYPVGVVAPFTLLIPVVGILSSVFFLGEPFQLWKLAAGLLVISGLCINIISTYFLKDKRELELA